MHRSKYNIITTEDGTSTLYSNDYNEAMHSTSGAYEEALKKHVLPSKILDSSKKNLNILDIGFGLGYNILALLVEIFKTKPGISLDIISFEKNKSYLPYINSITFNDEKDYYFDKIKSAFTDNKLNLKNHTMKIMFGDARNSIRSISNIQFDAVFHDPFSPSKNPELWSVEFFKEIFRLIDDSAILTTYSSAPQIRVGLIEAGFFIGKGPSVGPKKEGTVASKKNNIESLNEDEITILKNNIKSTPYHDNYLNNPPIQILEKRIEIMRKLKSKAYRPAHQE